jgi:hypothetical protein
MICVRPVIAHAQLWPFLSESLLRVIDAAKIFRSGQGCYQHLRYAVGGQGFSGQGDDSSQKISCVLCAKRSSHTERGRGDLHLGHRIRILGATRYLVRPERAMGRKLCGSQCALTQR